MARIKVISYEEATGRLKNIYDDLLEKRGGLAEVHKIQSLKPQSIVAHMELYMEIMYSKSELKRSERELMGTVVSIANGCKYCTKHHADALNHYWKDVSKIDKIKAGAYREVLSPKELILVEFAAHLTLNPTEHEHVDFTEKLKKIGLSDAAILHTVLVVAYFNFVNRIVLSLGVELESNSISSYKY